MDCQTLADEVRQIGAPVQVVGGKSKYFLGKNIEHLPEINVRKLNGIIHYEPSELVMQVQAGTPLTEVLAILDAEGQMLAAEPPVFNGKATVGGMIAAGISGSRRPYVGAVRDFVLGVDVITGQGDLLSFGGQVMKNVAGYDVSRLLVGSMGCLGIITEVSFKVLPKPETEQTCCIQMDRQDALEKMWSLKSSSLVSASAYYQEHLYVRFSGADSSVANEVKFYGGEKVSPEFWQNIDNLAVFKDAKNLWRISVAPSSQVFVAEADLIDWGGGQRWLVDPMFDPRSRIGSQGHATLIRGDQSQEKYHPLGDVVLNLHLGLKQQFDPKGHLNPNKMYSAF